MPWLARKTFGCVSLVRRFVNTRHSAPGGIQRPEQGTQVARYLHGVRHHDQRGAGQLHVLGFPRGQLRNREQPVRFVALGNPGQRPLGHLVCQMRPRRQLDSPLTRLVTVCGFRAPQKRVDEDIVFQQKFMRPQPFSDNQFSGVRRGVPLDRKHLLDLRVLRTNLLKFHSS